MIAKTALFAAFVTLTALGCSKDQPAAPAGGAAAGHQAHAPAGGAQTKHPTAAGGQAAAQPAAATTPKNGRIEVTVTEKGFEPENIQVKAGEPVTMVFTRKTDKTCATEVILWPSENQKIEKVLPVDQPVEVAVTFPKSGTVRYACAMDHIAGVVTVQ